MYILLNILFFAFQIDNSDICAYIEIKYVYLKNKIYFDRESVYVHLFIIVIFCENFMFKKRQNYAILINQKFFSYDFNKKNGIKSPRKIKRLIILFP